ncbi:sigma factor G inhibitor Gin [Shouchella shacheensis]|uniref:sigma factor G inhibitor Gin n=1 Tax=Shouchella shacheensis TaxID=1649580 RepID=UPI00073FC667|nr:sigma factor G inhibitor Gin [Shouchella shacheensis]
MERRTVMRIKLGDYCGVCETLKPKGYHLGEVFICEGCEDKMVRTEPEDSDYEQYVSSLKGIWDGLMK